VREEHDANVTRKNMRTTYNTMILTGAMVLAIGARAQNYVAIEGHVSPCAGQTYDVHVQTWPGVEPVLDTVVQTGPDCAYFLMYYPTSITGFFHVSTSCDSGMILVDSAYFEIGFLGGDTVVVDAACGDAYDCNGVFNGPAMPGAPCDDGDPFTNNDTWSGSCICVGDTNVYDCTGMLNGPSMPGTACVDMTPDSTWFFGTWSTQCACTPDSNYLDCLGVPNGPNMPGTSCDDGNPLTLSDEWTPGCICTGYIPAPCQAYFMIVQAIGEDSVFIPEDLWLYNLSSGGAGTLTCFWDFGDGTTTTENTPVHSYAGNGPYWLCLTVDDGQGCTNTYCDSVSVDENGIVSGMMGDIGSRSSGFTLNVIDEQISTGIAVPPATPGLLIWPDPVSEELNVALAGDLTGMQSLTVLDMNGRVVKSQGAALMRDMNRLRIGVADLQDGVYLLRIGSGLGQMSKLFVKSH
jgi:hypothetical protein